MEIPMFLRDSLELDLASMLSLGKFTASRDMLLHIHTLNAIRRASVTSGEIVLLPPEDYVTKIKFNLRGPDIFLKVIYTFLINKTISFISIYTYFRKKNIYRKIHFG